jgi:hypothetical protein
MVPEEDCHREIEKAYLMDTIDGATCISIVD